MLNKLITNILPHLPKKMVWIFSKRYIAGETIEEGLSASKQLNAEKIEVTVDLLGEFIKTVSEADDHKNQYLKIIERFTDAGIKGTFSIKPTMFGLLIDEDVCYKFMREIVEFAAKKNSFVRIDMEDSQCVDMELEIFKKLKKEFPENVGIVLQAYLRRTFNDLRSLKELQTESGTVNVRLCKGIYIESEKIAFKNPQKIRDHYLEDLEYMLMNKMYVGIATHDKYLIENAFKLIEKHQVKKTGYEFQMLYGVTPELRQTIVNEGHLMRVYVPFGKHWFNYSTRRLKENPKIANHIIKALFVRG